MQVNIATLSIVIAIQSLLMGTLLLLVSTRQADKAARGIMLRGVAMLLQGVGYLLKAERGIMLDFLTMQMSMGLVMLGHGVTLCALRMLLGLPEYTRQIAAAILLCWISIACITLLAGDSRQQSFAMLSEVYSIGYAIAVVCTLGASLGVHRAVGARILLVTSLFMMATQIWLFVSNWTSLPPLVATTVVMLLTALMPTLTGVAFLMLYTEVRQTELKDLAKIDPLTGINNRRAIFNHLAKIRRGAAVKGRPISTLLIDIDHFKSINDTYGHLAGDRVLVEAATLLNSVLRRGEYIGRFGGDEFMVIVPDTDEAGAIQIAERLRSAIETLSIAVNGGQITPSVSIGVAVNIPSDCSDDKVHVLRADTALYRAKREGRNRVAIWRAVDE